MKIVVGMDDAPCSRAALETLERMPWSRDASWRLVSVIETPVMARTVPMLAPEAVRAMQSQRTIQREWLTGIDLQLRSRGFASRATVDLGDPRTCLMRAAREEPADLLVVGSHGRTGLSRWLLGSVAAYLVVHAPCSVLVARGTQPIAAGRPMNIVLGVDDSPGSLHALRFVRDLSWPEGTRLHLLSVAPTPRHPFLEAGPVSLHVAREQTRTQQDLVARYANQALADGWRCESSVPEGDPRIELENAAQRLEADLLVVGSHGRTGLSRFVLGSVASHLVAHAPCSVLVVRSPIRHGPATRDAGRVEPEHEPETVSQPPT